MVSKDCVRQELKKYTSRPSPPFPANECCGEIFQGNDGREYISVADKNGICKWKVVSGKKINSPKKVVFEKPLVKPTTPKKVVSPKKQPTKLSIEGCLDMKVVELKQILSNANVAGRSKLTKKDDMCREIVRLGL